MHKALQKVAMMPAPSSVAKKANTRSSSSASTGDTSSNNHDKDDDKKPTAAKVPHKVATKSKSSPFNANMTPAIKNKAAAADAAVISPPTA
jgi:hypothetical protein